MPTPPVRSAWARGRDCAAASESAPFQGVAGTAPLRRLFLAALYASLLCLTQAFAATIDVTTTLDELDFVPNGRCSLREAIVSVNEGRNVGGCTASGAYGSSDTVNVPAGTYYLTRDRATPLPIEPDQDIDNLNPLKDVRLLGAGVGVTIIDGSKVGPSSPNGNWVRFGGVIDNLSSTVHIQDMTITGGSAAYGGGILNAGSLTLNRVEVAGNEGWLDGGGILNWGHLVIENSTIADNVADADSGGIGGGIFNRASLLATNVTISGNEAGVGGGVATGDNGGAQVRTILSSVTITDNVGNVAGGGIAQGQVVDPQFGEPFFRMESTIVAGNRSGTAPDCQGEFESHDFNLIGDASGCAGFTGLNDQKGTGAAPLDPLLAPLANYGGPTRTHALLLGSPAIDRGPLQLLDSCPATDQRGFPRANDGDGNGFLHCDVGAYEAPELVRPQANLAVELAVTPDPVGAGAALTYTMTLTNHGPNDAEAVEYSFEAPGTLTAVPAGCNVSGTVATCAHGAFSVGRVTRQFTVTAPASQGSVIGAVSVSSSTEDPDPSDNYAQVGAFVVAPNTADLALAIAGPSSAEPGAELVYVLTVRNLGPEASGEDTRVSALLPATTEFIGATSGCTRLNQQFNCVIGPLAHGSSVAVELRLRAPGSPGTVTLTASTLGDPDQDGVLNNNNASWGTRIDVPHELSADLALTKHAPAQVQPGSSFDYLLVIANHGPDVATDVVITDTLPEGVALQAAAPGCSLDAGTVTCEIEAIPVGASETLWLTVAAPTSEGELTNVANVAGSTADPDATDNEAEAVTLVTTEAPVDVPSVVLAQHPEARNQVTAAASQRGVVALRFTATAGESEGVAIDALTLRLLTKGDPEALGRVAWYLDADGDGKPDEPTPLAEGRFEEGGLSLAPALPRSAGVTVAAGSTVDYLLVVDLDGRQAHLPAGEGASGAASLGFLARGVGTRGAADAILPALASLAAIGSVLCLRGSGRDRLGIRALRAYRAPLVVFLVLTTVLLGCQTAAPQAQNRGSHQLVLDSVSASGAITMAEADVTGLPLEGALIEVR